MNNILIVSLADELDEYSIIAKDYNVGYEINDFVNPEILDDEVAISRIIEAYKQLGIPKNSTMHGAFYDTILFSLEPTIREFAKKRMRQSMLIARKLGVIGVVFHTNYNPDLAGDMYDKRAVDYISDYIAELLEEFSDISIYLENMFENSSDILINVAKRLQSYKNFGLCLDYAHANVYVEDTMEFVDDMIPYVKHIHVNDNNLLEDQHLAIGDGDINWNVFAEYYKKIFCNYNVLIETTKPENQIKSLEFLNNLNL